MPVCRLRQSAHRRVYNVLLRAMSKYNFTGGAAGCMGRSHLRLINFVGGKVAGFRDRLALGISSDNACRIRPKGRKLHVAATRRVNPETRRRRSVDTISQTAPAFSPVVSIDFWRRISALHKEYLASSDLRAALRRDPVGWFRESASTGGLAREQATLFSDLADYLGSLSRTQRDTLVETILDFGGDGDGDGDDDDNNDDPPEAIANVNAIASITALAAVIAIAALAVVAISFVSVLG